MTVSKTQPMRSAEIALIDDYNTNIGLIPNIQDDISDLQTTVGDNTSGLVKDVDDLQTTVGDNTSGLVKDVSDNANDINALETVVGDSSSGLVYDVSNLDSNVNGIQITVGNLQDDVSALQSGNEPIKVQTINCSYNGSAAYVVVSRGASACIYILDYFGANSIAIGTALPAVTIAKQTASRDFSITNTGNDKSILLSSNAYVIE